MVKFNWSTFWIVLVSCFWTMILAFFVELYLVGAMMIVMAIAITGVWCISLLRRILALLEQNQNMTDEAGQASEKQSAQAE
ncbi:MAG: hypothetical protein ACLR53_06665 [Evtepia gabavorous]